MAVQIGCWATDTGAETIQMWVREDRSLESGRCLPSQSMGMRSPYRQLGGYRPDRCTLKSQQLVERHNAGRTGDFCCTSSPGQAVVNERLYPAAFPAIYRSRRLLLLTRRKSEVTVVSLESPTIWGSSLLSQQVHLPKYKYSRQIADRNSAPPLVKQVFNNGSSFISVIA